VRGWLADRRQARAEGEAEQRLRDLAVGDGRKAVYVPGHIVATLGPLRTRLILREYGATMGREPL
jgi:hypothetical protein